MIERIYAVVEAVRAEFAPDPRTSVFEVDATRDGAGMIVFGTVSDPAAAEALHARIGTLELGVPVRDEIARIPGDDPDTLAHGIVTAAIAPMLAGPLISESHLSQVVLGSRVFVLREYGRWLQCRASDGYLGWIHRGYLRRVDEPTARAWEAGGTAPLFFSCGARVIAADGDFVTPLPWGARFGLRGDVAVLPDGGEGTLHGSAVAMTELPRRFPRHGEAIVRTAGLWSGTPYLWGGVTPWGVDCSGLAQAVYRTHGVELPRDSDQQAVIGAELPCDDLGAFRPGDLLFFAEQQDRVSHVAISAGGSRIIHSSLGNGGVRENDLAGGSGYERELSSLLVSARRLIETED